MQAECIQADIVEAHAMDKCKILRRDVGGEPLRGVVASLGVPVADVDAVSKVAHAAKRNGGIVCRRLGG